MTHYESSNLIKLELQHLCDEQIVGAVIGLFQDEVANL